MICSVISDEVGDVARFGVIVGLESASREVTRVVSRFQDEYNAGDVAAATLTAAALATKLSDSQLVKQLETVEAPLWRHALEAEHTARQSRGTAKGKATPNIQLPARTRNGAGTLCVLCVSTSVCVRLRVRCCIRQDSYRKTGAGWQNQPLCGTTLCAQAVRLWECRVGLRSVWLGLSSGRGRWTPATTSGSRPNDTPPKAKTHRGAIQGPSCRTCCCAGHHPDCETPPLVVEIVRY